MNKKLLISSVILSVVTLYAGAMFSSFSVKSQNGNVVLNWQTTSETSLKNFVVERTTLKGNFIEIAAVEPRSDRNYEYVDHSAFKTNDAVYKYRIKIVDNDGSVSYSDERSVVHNVSSVSKRTWGSIKALFR